MLGDYRYPNFNLKSPKALQCVWRKPKVNTRPDWNSSTRIAEEPPPRPMCHVSIPENDGRGRRRDGQGNPRRRCPVAAEKPQRDTWCSSTRIVGSAWPRFKQNCCAHTPPSKNGPSRGRDRQADQPMLVKRGSSTRVAESRRPYHTPAPVIDPWHKRDIQKKTKNPIVEVKPQRLSNSSSTLAVKSLSLIAPPPKLRAAPRPMKSKSTQVSPNRVQSMPDRPPVNTKTADKNVSLDKKYRKVLKALLGTDELFPGRQIVKLRHKKNGIIVSVLSSKSNNITNKIPSKARK